MNARSKSDRLKLAAAYEQQAARDRGTSERHRKLALAYAQSWSPVVPWSHSTGRDPIGSAVLGNTASGNAALVEHCVNLAKVYAQASSTNLELAAVHRQASGGATK